MDFLKNGVPASIIATLVSYASVIYYHPDGPADLEPVGRLHCRICFDEACWVRFLFPLVLPGTGF